MPNEKPLDLSDKILVLFVPDMRYDATIENGKFETQEGRLFLVGNVPKGCSRGDWLAGTRIGVAWDQVRGYFIFDSFEEYRSRYGWKLDPSKEDPPSS